MIEPHSFAVSRGTVEEAAPWRRCQLIQCRRRKDDPIHDDEDLPEYLLEELAEIQWNQ